jgi:hypothetical protein
MTDMAIDRAMDRAAFLYEKAPIQALPWIGSGLEAVLGERLDLLKATRFHEWLRLLHGCLKALDQEKVDKTFLESEEFLAPFMRTAKEASDCWETEKLSVFAQFLANSLMVKGSYPGYRERTLAVVAGLCIGHVVVLREVERDQASLFRAPVGLVVAIKNMRQHEILGFANDLDLRGLVCVDHMHTGEVRDGSPAGTPAYRLTELGREILKFIRSDAKGTRSPDHERPAAS